MPLTAADRHRRTRRDHAGETAEDYAEAVAVILDQHGVCRLVDLAERFGVSHVTANRVVARLEREGLIDTAPYQPIELTPAGRRLARAAQRRHQTVLDFLRALGVSERTANIDAEGIEHHVSPETLRAFAAFAESHGQV